MASIRHCVCPEYLVQPTVRQEAPYLLQQSMVESFCHPILLQSLSNCGVSLNAFITIQLQKQTTLVLSSIIRHEYLDLIASLQLYYPSSLHKDT